MSSHLTHVLKNLDTVDKVDQAIIKTLQQIDQNISAAQQAALKTFNSLAKYQSIRRKMIQANAVKGRKNFFILNFQLF